MSSNWRHVALGEVVAPVSRPVPVEPLKDYRLLGVRLDGGGPFLRETKKGSQLSAKRLFEVKYGDFIYSRLFAWRGAFGFVPEVLDGCFVSNEFPTFVPRDSQVDVRFLNYWFKLPPVLRRVEEDCTGSTPLTRNRYREEFFLRLEAPMPPLADQRRTVARIDEVVGKLAEARTLRRQVAEGLALLARALLLADGSAVPTRMADLVRLREPDVAVRPEESYQFAGVFSFGRGVFRAQMRSGMEFAYPRLTRLRQGDFVYPKLMAWEGAFGVVPPECDGCVVSTEFPVFEVDPSRVFPEVLDTYFRTPSVWQTISGASTGTNVRRRRLNPETFLSYKMPLPGMHAQERVRAVKRKADAISATQTETAVAFEALLPSILDKAFKADV